MWKVGRCLGDGGGDVGGRNKGSKDVRDRGEVEEGAAMIIRRSRGSSYPDYCCYSIRRARQRLSRQTRASRCGRIISAQGCHRSTRAEGPDAGGEWSRPLLFEGARRLLPRDPSQSRPARIDKEKHLTCSRPALTRRHPWPHASKANVGSSRSSRPVP